MRNVFLAVSICIGLFATQSSAARPQPALPAAPAATLHSVSVEGSETEQFQGVIVSKNGEILVLRDDVNNTWYHLDDQEAAAKHLGKKVLVTGNLDTRTDMIRVQSIAETT